MRCGELHGEPWGERARTGGFIESICARGGDGERCGERARNGGFIESICAGGGDEEDTRESIGAAHRSVVGCEGPTGDAPTSARPGERAGKREGERTRIAGESMRTRPGE